MTKENPHDLFVHITTAEGGRVGERGVERGSILVRRRFGSEPMACRTYGAILQIFEDDGRRADRVHVISSWRTSGVIPFLMKELPDPQILKIGSPIITTGKTSHTAALNAMVASNLPGSTGGFHTAQSSESAVYQLLYQVLFHLKKSDDQQVIDRLMPLIVQHPVWPALSFIPTLHLGCALNLLVCLVDPRCHVDPDKPDSTEMLDGFMGRQHLRKLWQTLTTERQLVIGHHSSIARAATWMMTTHGGDPELGSIEPGLHPQDFLRRHKPVAACVEFMRFIIAYWRDQTSVSHRLFDPREFFDSPETEMAWDRHMRSLAQTG